MLVIETGEKDSEMMFEEQYRLSMYNLSDRAVSAQDDIQIKEIIEIKHSHMMFIRKIRETVNGLLYWSKRLKGIGVMLINFVN